MCEIEGVDGGTYLGLLLSLETDGDDEGFCDSVALLRVRCGYWRRTGGVSSGEEASTSGDGNLQEQDDEIIGGVIFRTKRS